MSIKTDNDISPGLDYFNALKGQGNVVNKQSGHETVLFLNFHRTRN